MVIENLLERTEVFEIETFRRTPVSARNFRQFRGFPRKHPYDPEKIILIANPYSPVVSCFEFYLKDIEAAEDLPNLVSESGESVPMVKIWVRKGSLGVKSSPFIV